MSIFIDSTFIRVFNLFSSNIGVPPLRLAAQYEVSLYGHSFIRVIRCTAIPLSA